MCNITININLVNNLPSFLLLFTEDAYRIDADVDGEVVGLDIIDTAGQVSS